MVSGDIKKGIAVLFSMAVLSFSVTGCGGGSSSDTIAQDDGITESELVSITVENSAAVTETVFDAIGVGFAAKNGPTFKSTSSSKSAPMLKVLEQPALKQVLSQPQNLKTLAESGSYACIDGGSISYSGTETSVTAIYNNCQEYGTTINGSMAVTASSDATSGTMTLTNFSITDIDGNNMFYEYMKYTFQFNANYELSSMSITMDGYTDILGERTDFQNYTFTMSVNSSDTTTFSIDGFIKTACLGAWIEIKTITDIQVNAFVSCPTSGQIVIGGNTSSLTIDFNADGSVDVSGSITEHYTSCDALDSGVCSNW